MLNEPLDHSINAVAHRKGGINYAMACAWACRLSDTTMICSLGPQSATGNALEPGDRVGFSNLASDQLDIAFALGARPEHSGDVDKLVGIEHIDHDGAITIAGASTQVVCEVVDILHLAGAESENCVLLRMLECESSGKPALHIADLPEE